MTSSWSRRLGWFSGSCLGVSSGMSVCGAQAQKAARLKEKFLGSDMFRRFRGTRAIKAKETDREARRRTAGMGETTRGQGRLYAARTTARWWRAYEK
jgi:hypothetical protein